MVINLGNYGTKRSL